MAHSHDQTLLAKLGFSDPDRKEPRHGLACRFLAEEAQARSIAASVNPRVRLPAVLNFADPKDDDYSVTKPDFLRSDLEYVLSGPRRFTIGFVDVINRFRGLNLVIEVKIAPVEADELLRQMNLYRDNMRTDEGYISRMDGRVSQNWSGSLNAFVAVLDFDVSQSYAAAIQSQGIHTARLGAGFGTWLEAQARTKANMVTL